ncbi:MAG: hypothetical protein HND44_21950 [Chloroflexi bacterium]|nr:hypothetical protein [Ardenticatenaceae bacterium]MBL1131109.1 hypothetical protein [Chloroflexota bacterium]NOG37206.1 hypothetical protein [Chloroflexota bacterium]GIK55257.1 MAG: hypothetical protein BroJett015_09200 [Chloroflexota bacterium]
MIILDENIIDSQRRLLNSWRIPVRQIGYEVGRKGMKDREIIPFLHQLNQPTLFTRDDDFYERRLCHAGYCLVYLDVRKEEVATFVRRVLRQKAFKTKTKRMGKVIRASHVGLTVWNLHAEKEDLLDWD